MANRGLSDEEISYVKGMIALNMSRDVIHSFFVSPGSPLTPAFVSEVAAGKIGTNIPQANREQTLAFIDSRIGFRRSLSRRSGSQLELFPEPPSDVTSPHHFSWSGSKLVNTEYHNYLSRSDKDAIYLLEEARLELNTLSSDTALGNHPRLSRRVCNLAEFLNLDISEINPVLAGARAKKVMESISISQSEFSDEFIGEISACMSSVLMFSSHFEEWRRFELTALSQEPDSLVKDNSSILALADQVAELPQEMVDASVPESIREFAEKASAYIDDDGQDTIDITVSASIKASVSYSTLSTVSQLAATLIRELRDAGKQAAEFGKSTASAIKRGFNDGVESSTSIMTSSIIVFYCLQGLKLLSESYPSMLGWMRPFIESFERQYL